MECESPVKLREIVAEKAFLDFENHCFSSSAFLDFATKQNILQSLDRESKLFGSHYISKYIGPLITDFCQKEFGVPYKNLDSLANKSESNSTINSPKSPTKVGSTKNAVFASNKK
jgi:hypothetical protein